MQTTVTFSNLVEHSNPDVQSDVTHRIKIAVDSAGNHILFECASREALFEFGRSLMEEALFGTGEVEYFPLVSDKQMLVVNGVRLTEDSSRIFVHYPREGKHDV